MIFDFSFSKKKINKKKQKWKWKQITNIKQTQEEPQREALQRINKTNIYV